MKNSDQKWFTVGIAISLSAATFANPMSDKMDDVHWDDSEQPTMLAHLTPKDYVLVKENGQDHALARKPWSGHWWPTFEGSVAHRSSTNMKEGVDRRDNRTFGGSTFNVDPTDNDYFYSADELAKMSEDDIYDALSPIEKLDVVAGHTVKGRSDFYKNSKEVIIWANAAIRSVPEQKSYHGICAGFANAAAVLVEPLPYRQIVTLTLSNKTTKQVSIVFGSGELKGLASYFYAKKIREDGFDRKVYDWVGRNGDDAKDGERLGLNAGTLHLLLQNLVLQKGKSFVIDTDLRQEVWNYPVVSYRSTTSATFATRSKDVDPRAVKEVDVRTTVTFADESTPTFLNFGFNNEYANVDKNYHYRLELTADDKIVGGTWMRDSDLAPDFAWRVKDKLAYDGDYVWLDKLWSADKKSKGEY